MKLIFSYLLFISLIIFTASCSDIKNDIVSDQEVSVHKSGIEDPASPNFHSQIFATINWDLNECKQCHGANYAGGVTGKGCNTCHTQPAGPEACNTCHGDFADPNMISPPNDLSGNSVTTAKGVGAHAIHLYDAAIAPTVLCFDCHIVVTGSEGFVALHTDGSPAEVELTGSAVSTISEPNYSYANLTCQNTYCHGNFEFLK
ncbi:MAG: hypothetical protein KJ799_01640, partial [Bacteroidetes bacterium]|nr:hypothetical protein [Bacteroidota bacterium]